AEIVNADDVFVVEVAGGAGLGEEAGLGFLILRGSFGEDLDGHGTAHHRVHGAIDVRHPAAEKFLQFVFADAGWELYQFPRNALTRLKILYHDMVQLRWSQGREVHGMVTRSLVGLMGFLAVSGGLVAQEPQSQPKTEGTRDLYY